MPDLLRLSLCATSLAVLVVPAFAANDAPEPGTEPPATYQAVLDCQKLSDPATRLACFDKSVRVMAESTQKKDVVVIDRATIRETKRGLFGISLPKIKMFGGNDDVEVNQIESSIASAHAAKDGFSVFVLADGSRWKQTEGRFTYPKPGQKIVVKRAALGGFMANVNDQPGIRVIRLSAN